MKTLEFSITIKSSPEVIWDCLWLKENYTLWTSIFCNGSYYETDSFIEGNKIHLLCPNGSGLSSVLEKLAPPKVLIFKHIQEIKNFSEQPLTKEDEDWTNSLEKYEIIYQHESESLLKVTVDTIDSCVEHMNNTFPLALNKVKIMAENHLQ